MVILDIVLKISHCSVGIVVQLGDRSIVDIDIVLKVSHCSVGVVVQLGDRIIVKLDFMQNGGQ